MSVREQFDSQPIEIHPDMDPELLHGEVVTNELTSAER